jgi:hypothetical protein
MSVRVQIKTFLLIISFSSPATKLFAQKNAEDSAIFKNAFNNSVSLYYQSLGDQSGLYNGTKYAGYPFTFSEGIPFFLSNKQQKGSIEYDHVVFQNINLLYDELSGVVIMQDDDHNIQLLNEKISWFMISGFRFIYLINSGQNSSAPPTGFYNILYDGHVSVLKKEIKQIREILAFSGEEKTHVIDSRTNYYFKQNTDYAIVNTQNELLGLFHDKKKEIQHFIKTNKLNFKKDPDNLLTKVAEYFDQTTK